VPPLPDSATGPTQRLRIRFRKEGDLRWISHRDLARAMERLMRRAGLALKMSAGFHPKPKLSFPSALAVGIEGRDEVLELELLEPVDPADVRRRLATPAPRGLVIERVREVGRAEGKARVRCVTYQFPVPAAVRDQVEQARRRLCEAPSLLVSREDRPEPLDVTRDLVDVDWTCDAIRFRLRASPRAGVRPREILRLLGVAELEHEGAVLTRSKVELMS
jgi:radical SAM-linked protein